MYNVHVASSPTRIHCFKQIRSTTHFRIEANHCTNTSATFVRFHNVQILPESNLTLLLASSLMFRRQRGARERSHRHIVGGAKLFPFRFMPALKTR